MILDKNYDSKIGHFFKKVPFNYFFISDWDLHNKDFMIDTMQFYETVISDSKYRITDYYFINERTNEKEILINTFNRKFETFEYRKGNITIFPNGTVAAASFLHILKKTKLKNALLLSPIYFTYIDILKEEDYNIYYFSAIDEEGKISIEFERLFELITTKNIDVLFINQPLFGCGINMDLEAILKILNFCEINSITVFIDCIYGNIDWNEKTDIIPKSLNKLLKDNTIILISLSKNLFFNGAKTCIAFASERIISDIERYSVFEIGSMSHVQIETLKSIYDKENEKWIIDRIDKIKNHVKTNYSLLVSLLSNSDIKVVDSNSGIFTIMGVPKKYFSINSSDDEISNQILNNQHILTIPHNRYLLYSKRYYWFRVNLSYPTDILIPQVSKFLQFNI